MAAGVVVGELAERIAAFAVGALLAVAGVLLQALGFEVLEAGSGTAAVSASASSRLLLPLLTFLPSSRLT